MTSAPCRLPHPVRAARQGLKAKGWSYRLAAADLGVCYQHLSEVLNGHRTSRRLLSRIESLPVRKETAR